MGVSGSEVFGYLAEFLTRLVDIGEVTEGEGIPYPCDSRSGQGLCPGKKISLSRGGFRSRLLYLLGLIPER